MNNTVTKIACLEMAEIYKLLMLSFFAVVLYTTMVSTGYAFGNTLCGIYNAGFKGGVARGIATFAVVALGIGASFGKVSWGLAILVIIGIASMFGAGDIALSLGGGC